MMALQLSTRVRPISTSGFHARPRPTKRDVSSNPRWTAVPRHVAEGNWASLFASAFLKHLDVQARQATAIAVVQCDRLAASDLDPQKPATIPGVPVSALNPKLAVPACEAAVKAAPGDARTIFQLGRAYAEAKSYEKARANYEQADALGHALATNNLGALYEDGWGVERDLAQARRLYQKAAQAGVPLAITNAGRLAERGDGGPQDYAEARQWYERRRQPELGAPHTGSACSITKGSACSRIWHRRGTGTKRLPHAATTGACSTWAFYERGEGVAIDYTKAREWYEKAAAAGNGVAMSNIGVLYARGWGVPQDYTMARRWYERSASAGHPAGMLNLGLIYQYGRSVPIDYAAGRAWYEKALAVDANFSRAMLTLASLYEEGHGVPRDLAEARRWYEKALAAGNEDAEKQLARIQKISETKH
jgi:TPR repeat protein